MTYDNCHLTRLSFRGLSDLPDFADLLTYKISWLNNLIYEHETIHAFLRGTKTYTCLLEEKYDK